VLARVRAVPHDHAPRPVDPAGAAQQVDPVGLEPGLLARVVVGGHHEVAPREGAGRVHAAAVDRLAGARRLARRLQRLAGAQQRLRGDARPVRALAADELALDERDAQPAVGERPGAVLAGGPAAEHDDVVGGGHASPCALSISYAAVISPMWL
jgi:hypothetical protein